MFDRILVTGATGFVGSWVLQHWCEAHPNTVIWATGDVPEPSTRRWDHYSQVDLCDPEAVKRLVTDSKPDGVIHLAGVIGSAPLKLCLSVNVLGTENLFQALAAANLTTSVKVVQISSAAVYGLVQPEELPIREDQPPRPVSAYAISKLAQDQLALAWHRRDGLDVKVARAFNVLGPGQPDDLVPMAFLRQILAIRAGKSDNIRVGNLTPTRDFVDIRDAVVALDMLLRRGRAGGVYNIGSGVDVSIQQVLSILTEFHGSRVMIEASAGKQRATDVSEVRADISLIRKEVGWRPKLQLEQSLRAMWDGSVGASN